MFEVYSWDEGNKKNKNLVKQTASVDDGYGRKKSIEINGSYQLAYRVIERIEPNKHIKREIVDIAKFSKNLQAKIDSGELKI